MSHDNDNMDRATEHAEIYIGSIVRKPEGPQANGRCHWCDEILDDHARFCDASCRDNYEKYGAPE